MDNLYFVSARMGWDTVFAGHWLAVSPKEAIKLAQSEIVNNNTGIGLNSLEGLEFKATKSNANRSQALNS